MMMHALESLLTRATPLTLQRAVYLAIGHDEEVGGAMGAKVTRRPSTKLRSAVAEGRARFGVQMRTPEAQGGCENGNVEMRASLQISSSRTCVCLGARTTPPTDAGFG